MFFQKKELARASKESVCRDIWKDKKENGNLPLSLWITRKRYRKRESTKNSRGVLSNGKLIEDLPKIVDLKQRFGDLEIDAIIGKNYKGALVTINDRATRVLKIENIAFIESQIN